MLHYFYISKKHNNESKSNQYNTCTKFYQTIYIHIHTIHMYDENPITNILYPQKHNAWNIFTQWIIKLF